MRIAVLSDIHANLAALEAVIGDLPPVEETWVLGDIVGYGPQPREVFETRLCLFGHTHQPVFFHDFDGEIETTPGRPGSRAPIDAATRVLVNPGSVGQPRDGNPDAAYAIVDVDRSGQALVEFRRVTYDIARTQRLMQEAGLPPRLAERLLHGR